MLAIGIFDLAFVLSKVRIEGVAQDGEQPAPEFRAKREFLAVGPGLEKGLLRQNLGAMLIAGQFYRTTAQRHTLGR